MGLIDVIKPLSIVQSSAANLSKQQDLLKFWECEIQTLVSWLWELVGKPMFYAEGFIADGNISQA